MSQDNKPIVKTSPPPPFGDKPLRKNLRKKEKDVEIAIDKADFEGPKPIAEATGAALGSGFVIGTVFGISSIVARSIKEKDTFLFRQALRVNSVSKNNI
jgi:hypothetical protein